MRKELSMDLPFPSAGFTFETSRAFRVPAKDSDQYHQLLELYINHTEGTAIGLDKDLMDDFLGTWQGDSVWRVIRVKGDISFIIQLFRTFQPNWPETVTVLRILFSSEQVTLEALTELSELVHHLTSSPDSRFVPAYDFEPSLPQGQICMILLVGKQGKEGADDVVHGSVPPEC